MVTITFAFAYTVSPQGNQFKKSLHNTYVLKRISKKQIKHHHHQICHLRSLVHLKETKDAFT
jgi:hypothetical protein